MDLRLYIASRLVAIIPTLFLLSLLTFFFSKPYLPVYGSFLHGYFSYLSMIFHGNFGIINTAMFKGQFISGITLYFPVTLEIATLTSILTLLIGIPLGTYIGDSNNRSPDYLSRIITFAFYAMPVFWISIILEFTFGSRIGFFSGLFGGSSGLPVCGQGYSSAPNMPWITNDISSPTHMLFLDSLLHGDFTLAYIALLHLVIPVVALTLSMLSIIVRYIRGGIMDRSNSASTRNAVERGLNHRIITANYSMRNGYFPSATIIGLMMAYLLSGSLVVEYFFKIKGLGFLTVEIISNLNSIEANGLALASLVLFFGIVFMTANLAVDLVYYMLNPEVRV